jgi:hypothetical protein
MTCEILVKSKKRELRLPFEGEKLVLQMATAKQRGA